MADAFTPFVSIIVPVRNGKREIRDCIVSLLRVDYPVERREILVVDNDSTDGTAQIIQSYPVQYLREARRGPSCARNRGIEESLGEILAFTDADCVVSTGWLRELVKGFEDNEVWGVAGEIFSYPPKTPAQRYLAVRKSRWQKPAVHSQWWPFAVTANVAFRKETFRNIGLFDPLFITAEDKDFGRRFLEAGLKLQYSPKSIVLHRHRTTAWGFFKQHVGWGYGGALLHKKYQIPWGLRSELGKYRELMGAVWDLAKAGVRYEMKGGNRMDIYYPYFEVLRRVAYRVGALRGMMSGVSPTHFGSIRQKSLQSAIMDED